MDRTILVEVFRQIIDGDDIPTPKGMLRIKPEVAAIKVDEVPYSLLTNLAHAVLWQRFWLTKIAGGRKNSNMTEWKNDFRVPDPAEFTALRSEFLDGLNRAMEIAGSEPFDHAMESDELAVRSLVCIAVHGAYHCGQMNLLKRLGRSP